ncbi:hypothetical protein V8B97DRAFT_1146288 [Scleroderma yunnanense]
MALSRSLFSLLFMLFFKALLVIVNIISGGEYYAFLDWRNSEKLLKTHKSRILKQLSFAIVTFRIGKRMTKHSLVTLLLFAIVVIRFLAIQVRLAKMARSLQQLHGPLLVTFWVVVSATLFYLKLTIEVAFAAYYLSTVCRAPSFGNIVPLVLNVFRLLELR